MLNYVLIELMCCHLLNLKFLLLAALRAVHTCQYLVYSEADFEVFHVAPMAVKFGMEEGTDLRSPPPCQISPPSVQRVAPAGRKTSKSASE